MTTTVNRRLRAAAILATAAIALGGCMKLDMDIELHEDDTFSGVMVMAFSDKAAESLGMDPQALWDEMGEDAAADAPPGSSAEPYAQDGYTGERYVFDSVPLSEMDGADEGALTIVREGDEYVVSGTMDLSEDAMGTAGTETDEATEAIMASFDVRFAVTFPGEVASHNGTLDGTTVVWQPQLGAITEISARGSAVAGGSSDGGSEQDEADDEAAARPTDKGTADDDGTGDGTDDAAAGEAAAGGLPTWVLVAGLGLLVVAAGAVLAVALARRGRGAAHPTAPGTTLPPPPPPA